MAIAKRFLRRCLSSRHASWYVVAAVLTAVLSNERAWNAIVLRQGGVPAYVPVRLKPRDALGLPRSAGTLLHVGFEDGFFGFGKEVGRVDVGDSFTLEVIGLPRRHQPAHAHIVSNHPGVHDFEGFAIRHDRDVQNTFTFMIGNGSTWRESPSFYLPPLRRFYLAVVVERTRVSVFKDGALLLSTDLGDIVRPSELPLTVGNWPRMEHRFNGSIEEVRVSQGAFAADTIELNARRLGLPRPPAQQDNVGSGSPEREQEQVVLPVNQLGTVRGK